MGLLAQVVVARHARRTDSPDAAGSAAESRAREWLQIQGASWPRIDAHWLGAAYQHALDRSERHPTERAATRRSRSGAFYTPPALVRHLLDHALDPVLEAHEALPRVLDPACGCGAFLVEAARRICDKRPDAPRSDIAASLFGRDIDPLAATLCRLALWLELADPHEPSEPLDAQVTVGDSLLDVPPLVPFDVVLGNPPFLSQLSAATARGPAAAAQLRQRFGPTVKPYTDPAALFLQLAIDLVRDGGRIGMIVPVSVLASRDAAPVRGRVQKLAALRSLWLDTDGVFDAGVRTVALSLERAGDSSPIARFAGRSFGSARPSPAPVREGGTWGPLASDLLGVPSVRCASTGALSDLAHITAGFRDEYYAVVRALREAGPGPAPHELPVITVGLIEPARTLWGITTVKIAGSPRRRPCVDAESADGKLAAVVAQQRRPKLLVATQTRVIEVVPDPGGRFVALTPAIIVLPRDGNSLWKIGAALLSPVLSAWAAAEAFGAARSLGAIKPSAALLRRAPLPTDEGAWEDAAQSFRALSESPEEHRVAALREFGASACAAYGRRGADAESLLDWWLPRAAPSRDRIPHAPAE